MTLTYSGNKNLLKMALDLLSKEEEYRAINKELENKTKELLKEVNAVMRIQDTLVNEVDITKRRSNISVLYNEPAELNTNKQDQCISVQNLDTCDSNIPVSVNSMGAKGMNHYFRAKIKAMQSNYDKLHYEYRKKCDEIKQLTTTTQKLTEEKERWFQLCNSNKTTINKLENQVSLLTSRLQSKESENVGIKKEVEQLKKELKVSNSSCNTAEVRVNRAVEEIEKLKANLKNAKQEEKDLKDSYKKQINDLTAALRKNEKHKTELCQGFKKQMQLIDNLKRQKVLLEGLRLTEMCDSEFTKILDFNLESP